jgi:hypothetical protein
MSCKAACPVKLHAHLACSLHDTRPLNLRWNFVKNSTSPRLVLNFLLHSAANSVLLTQCCELTAGCQDPTNRPQWSREQLRRRSLPPRIRTSARNRGAESCHAWPQPSAFRRR